MRYRPRTIRPGSPSFLACQVLIPGTTKVDLDDDEAAQKGATMDTKTRQTLLIGTSPRPHVAPASRKNRFGLRFLCFRQHWKRACSRRGCPGRPPPGRHRVGGLPLGGEGGRQSEYSDQRTVGDMHGPTARRMEMTGEWKHRDSGYWAVGPGKTL